ncbi:BT_3928 family protein [Aureibacter tunicatorum]|uniref:Membrane protein YphA (DoxX/SURF4 family) n=1 Tax=Aureibacter tunicatorum TaxID=866807 RepID=A0AAE3XJW7_9BACT|nr:BT_3928 family protein [Aureibacter tunicatorum]MDR6237845.1 putative membrane protein YphA (DoxX/SURF4 family) [Aureibacter tunicatorum]BDD02880.1 hypothetical protein AUTU_03630 [Aureibacter tunicatorum]
MQMLNRIVRILTGSVFIFSGLVKLNDPQGTAIKMKEYFEIFASDFSSIFHVLIPYVLPLAVFVCVLEVMLGWALIFKYRMKLTLTVLMALIVYFGFLTFYSAYFNKVTDCGCFGDAIPLNPWESFWKDVVLGIMGLFMIFNYKKADRDESANWDKFMLALMIINVFIAYYAIEHLPYVDFRAYKVGANISESMKPSAPFIYEYTMEKDGKIYKFKDYPSDTSYHFQKMELLNPEAEPKITDYSVWNDDGDYTEESLQGVKLFIVMNDIRKSHLEYMGEISNLIGAVKADATSWILTASPEQEVENVRHEYQLAIPYYFADDTVLKAMIRSNPGLILISNGTILGKWHYNDIPTAEEVEKLIRKNSQK